MRLGPKVPSTFQPVVMDVLMLNTCRIIQKRLNEGYPWLDTFKLVTKDYKMQGSNWYLDLLLG